MNCKTCLYRFNCYIHLNDTDICKVYEQAQNQERQKPEVENDEKED